MRWKIRGWEAREGGGEERGLQKLHERRSAFKYKMLRIMMMKVWDTMLI